MTMPASDATSFASGLSDAFFRDVRAGNGHSARFGTTTIKIEGSPPPQFRSEVVSVRLSPQAKTALSQQQLALTVLQQAARLVTGRQNTDQPETQSDAVIVKPLEPEPTGTELNSTTDGPSFDEVLAQRQAMSPSERFYAGLDLDLATSVMSSDEKAAFLAAYDAKTLRIQDAADVPEADFHQTTTVVVGAGIGMRSNAEFNNGRDVGFAQGARWGLMQVDPFIGGTVVTWDDPNRPPTK